jgi:prophage DNA circulation protein
MSDWRDFLRDASWRGVPFAVLTHEARAGRSTAVHDYPFRDDVWVEDLGRAPRRFALTGFLVGDDVISVEDEMIEAAEVEGPGELVHPHFGLLYVSLLDFSAAARSDLGRVVELQFLFIQGGERSQLSIEDAGSGLLEGLSSALDGASLADFGAAMGRTLSSGAAVVGAVQGTVGRYTSLVQRVTGGSAGILRSVSSVASAAGFNVGRFGGSQLGSSRSLSGLTGGVTSLAGAASRGIGAVTSARAAVSRGVSSVTRLAGLL